MGKSGKSKAASAPAPARARARKSPEMQTAIRKKFKEIRTEKGAGLTGTAVSMLDSLVHTLFDHIADPSFELMRLGRMRTLKGKHLQGAVMVTCSGELAAHMDSEGRRAVASYSGA